MTKMLTRVSCVYIMYKNAMIPFMCKFMKREKELKNE